MIRRIRAEHALRKEWKKTARGRMKKHYWLMVVICLMMAVIGLDYSSSLSSFKTRVTDTDVKTVEDAAEDGTVKTDEEEDEEVDSAAKVLAYLISGRSEQGKEISQKLSAADRERNTKLGIVAVEHTRGVIAELVNGVSSGTLLVNLFQAIKTMTNSSGVATVLFTILCLLVLLGGYIFVLDVLTVIFSRFFLEMRIYDRVPIKRAFFLLRVKRWFNVAMALLRRDVLLILWAFTIVGPFIKGFSYMLVPYIMAENPDMKGKDAINLSRRMMNGHKLEAVCLRISFLPWKVLGSITWGLGGIFFTNPYKEAVDCEFYAHLRREAIDTKIEGYEALNDVYLYEKADLDTLEKAYPDAEEQINAEEKEEGSLKQMEQPAKKGLFRILQDWFGIVVRCDEAEKQLERTKANRDRLKDFESILAGEMYPRRLFPLHDEDRIRKMSSMHYDRNYQLTSLILIFFTLCIVGWLWEVSLHWIDTGKYSNRGVLHGPWLPIYGSGSVLILIILKKLRKNPALEFISAIVVCGLLEYFSGWILELTHDGERWWDYSGYFLNIHGRVCAEGLLVFGLGGLGIVYALAPFLDNMFRMIPRKIVIPVCVVLLVWYGGDTIYSSKHPNKGPGVTDTAARQINPEDPEGWTVSADEGSGCFLPEMTMQNGKGNGLYA